MKSEWAKVAKSQILFSPRISKARRSDAGQAGIWTVAHSGGWWFICWMATVAWFCHMQIKWSVLNRRLLFWREWSLLFLSDDDGRSGWSRGDSLKLCRIFVSAVRGSSCKNIRANSLTLSSSLYKNSKNQKIFMSARAFGYKPLSIANTNSNCCLCSLLIKACSRKLLHS